MQEILIMSLGFHVILLPDDTAICGNSEDDSVVLEKRINLIFSKKKENN